MKCYTTLRLLLPSLLLPPLLLPLLLYYYHYQYIYLHHCYHFQHRHPHYNLHHKEIRKSSTKILRKNKTKMQSLPLSPDAISPRWRNTCYTISNWLPSNILLNLPHPSDSRRAENPPWRFQRITHYLNGILQLNAILTLCVLSR